MILKIDFDSEEALYVQLCNQIIRGIATEMLHEGDSLPSVRQLADEIGINMHNGKIKKNGTVTDMDGDKVTVKNYMVVKIEDKN